MQNIYHIHTSSNSYSDSSWTEEDYILCDSDEEYNDLIKQYAKEVEDYESSGRAQMYGSWRFKISDEHEIEAEEYYYAHEWQGKSFTAKGVCFEKHLERSNHYTYILKPNSVTGLKECTDHGCGWMYGS